jgi:inositol 1,4,5-triphosphate receptor type 1
MLIDYRPVHAAPSTGCCLDTETDAGTSSWTDSIFNYPPTDTCSESCGAPDQDNLDDRGVLSIPRNETTDDREFACETLIMCIITSLNKGLRNGGGIGDVLRSPASSEGWFVARVIYDLLFFFIVIIIVLNLIFGVIIDTFADLRSEKQNKDLILKNTCFICGLDRGNFDNKSVSFEEHIKYEHNMWHYLHFIVLINVKDPTEFTGPESYVYSLIKDRNLDWFPRMRAMSLIVAEETDTEQNEVRLLSTSLNETNLLVRQLTSQLNELREQMSEQRKARQRQGLLHFSQQS